MPRDSATCFHLTETYNHSQLRMEFKQIPVTSHIRIISQLNLKNKKNLDPIILSGYISILIHSSKKKKTYAYYQQQKNIFAINKIHLEICKAL